VEKGVSLEAVGRLRQNWKGLSLRILITGDRGYIGTIMVRYLAARGHEVAGLDTDYYFDGDFGLPPEDYPRLRKDIRDVTGEDLAHYDAIVHLAALSNDPVGSLREEWTYGINYEASVKLAQLAKQRGVRRFLYASSCSMYGAAEGQDLLTEEAPLRPITAYAVSKVRTEEALANLADADFAPTLMRNATAYGVSPRLRADIVLNNLVGWAVTAGRIRILSDGTPWRPIVHVEDIAQAFSLVLEAPCAIVSNQTFNVGSNDQNYQVRDLAAVVATVAPECSVEYAGEAGPDPRNYRVDFGRFARAFPAFQPAWDAVKGARQLYEAYCAEGLTREAFQGRRYVRLNQIRHLLDTGKLDTTLRWRKDGEP
jgi:nucleoside-diphosphate-sugar epimerase